MNKKKRRSNYTSLSLGTLQIRPLEVGVEDEPRHRANGSERVLGQPLQIPIQRVGPPHPVQDKVVQRRVVPDEEVQLVRGQELNEILEREYPVEVNDPI